MQNTLPLTPGNPLRNVSGLARQIALPGEHMPLRFPSFPALERTAVIGFNQPVSVSLPASTPVAFTVCRQAAYPVWADLGFSSDLKYFHAVDYTTNRSAGVGTANESIEYNISPNLSGWTVSDRAASGKFCGFTGSPGTNHLAKWALLGRDTNLPGPEWIYVPAGGTNTLLTAVVSGSSAAVGGSLTWTVQLEVWNTPGESTNLPLWIFSGTINAGEWGSLATVPLSTATGAWVRPASLSVISGAGATASSSNYGITLMAYSGAVAYAAGTSAGLVTITSASVTGTTGTHMPLVFPAEFSNSVMPWLATRVTASALLCTNVSQVLVKGGTVLGGRISPAWLSPWGVTQSNVNGLHPAEKAYLPLETGAYTYCPPSTDLVFFGDYTVNPVGGAANAPLYVLSNDSMYNKMYLTAASTAEQVACTVSWHLEFRTSSALFQIGLSAMTLESLHSAQLVLAESGFFFENMTHHQILSRVIAAAKKYVPSMLAMVHPLAGKMATLMVHDGPSKPATTSASASGMTPRKVAVKKKKVKVAKKKSSKKKK